MGQNSSSSIPAMTEEQQRVHDIKAIMQFTTCSIIIPVQCLALIILLRYQEFRQNASYLIVSRLIFLDILQSLALLMTGFYQVFPQLADEIVFLRKITGIILTCFYLVLYTLQLELTIYRMLVVTGKCKPNKLPLFLKIFEGICWLGAILLAFGTWIQDSRRWSADEERWYYDLDKSLGELVNDLEVYFCIPLILVTNILYTILISMIFLKNKRVVLITVKDKKDVSLYMQNAVYTITHIWINVQVHLLDICEPCNSPYVFIVVKFIYNISFYWTALFLLLFNDSIRSKIWELKGGTAVELISGSTA